MRTVAYAERRGKQWRGRYLRPDGGYGSTSGHATKRAALDAAEDEESRIRHMSWVDPRAAEIKFSEFAEAWYTAIQPRLADSTAAKYRSYLDHQLLPHWSTWPLGALFHGHLEIERWVSLLHQRYSESSVAAYFALMSTIMNSAVRSHLLPANPCAGVRVTSGGYELDKLVATPAQVLRAAMRLHDSGLGLGGFVLCLANVYTGARWGELVGQQRREYHAAARAIVIREPLKEVGGHLSKGGRPVDAQPITAQLATARPPRRIRRGGHTKTPESTRMIVLPPSIATLYELLLASHDHLYVFTSPSGEPWYRSNFRERYWRPAWDGNHPDNPSHQNHTSPVLRWFTFHEGRHTHSTWLAADGIPEVARRARLGHRMRGMARVYEHVTPDMHSKIDGALEARWSTGLLALSADETEQLTSWLPHLRDHIAKLRANHDEHDTGTGQT
jgi:integrase